MMEAYLYGTIVALLLIALLAMFRAFRGPTAMDRVIAMNIITTEVVMILLIFAFLDNNIHYIDVSLVFVLGAFIATLCILKLLREDRLI